MSGLCPCVSTTISQQAIVTSTEFNCSTGIASANAKEVKAIKRANLFEPYFMSQTPNAMNRTPTNAGTRNLPAS